MGRYLLLVNLALIAGCGGEPTPDQAAAPEVATPQVAQPRVERRPEMDDFFVKWLKEHGHKEIVVDAAGVGVGDSAVRLQASLYGSKRRPDGFIVEVEFRIRLPSRGEIIEFVGGMGETEERAVNDALLNFALTTFHVAYKGFINAADPHLTATVVAVDGVDRNLIAGDILMRGGAAHEEFDLSILRAEIESVLKTFPLAPGPHWIKIVYSQNEGRPMTVSVTRDNAEQPELTERVKRLNWPRSKDFYMAKQFIVVQ